MNEKTLKLQIFENNKRTDKSVFQGKNIKECIQKMLEEMSKKGLI